MKVNVNTIRILFILANLGITAFVVLGYVEGMGFIENADAPGGSSAKELKNPVAFVYTEADYVQPESRESRLRSAATWLMPERPAPPVPIDTGPTEPAGEEPEEPEAPPGEPIEGGPLQKENWEYVHGIIFPDNPLKSWIRLEKKEENKPATTSSSRFSRSRTSSSRSSSLRRSSSSSKIRSSSSENTITLVLEKRWFKDEEKGLEFYVHDVAEDKIIYWTDNPKRMYSLPRVSESYYIEVTRGETLAPKKEEEEEEEEGETKEDREKKFFQRYPLGTRPLDQREEDYRKRLAGEETAGFLKPTNLGQDPAQKGPVRVRTPASSTSGSRSSSSSYRKPSSSSTKTSSAKKPLSAAEQSAQLGKALKEAEKSGKMTDSDRKQLGKIKEMLKGKDKK